MGSSGRDSDDDWDRDHRRRSRKRSRRDHPSPRGSPRTSRKDDYYERSSGSDKKSNRPKYRARSAPQDRQLASPDQASPTFWFKRAYVNKLPVGKLKNNPSVLLKLPDTENRKKWNLRKEGVVMVPTLRPLQLGMLTGIFTGTPAVITPTAPGKGPELKTQVEQRTRGEQRVVTEYKR